MPTASDDDNDYGEHEDDQTVAEGGEEKINKKDVRLYHVYVVFLALFSILVVCNRLFLFVFIYLFFLSLL
jgi:hypothetical protein